jgi:copper transport protein
MVHNELSLPERGIEPLEREAVWGTEGYRSVRNVTIRYSGRGHPQVDALVTDFQKITPGGEFDVPAR